MSHGFLAPAQLAVTVYSPEEIDFMSTETTDQLIRETIDLARAIAAGRREPSDAQRLIDHG